MNKETTFVNCDVSLESYLPEIAEMKIINRLIKIKKAKPEKPYEIAETPEKETNEVKTKEINEGETANRNFKFLHEVAVNTVGGIFVAVIIATGAKVTGIYDNIKSIPQLASKDDIADMVTTDDIASMVTEDDIADMVTTSDIGNMATQTDVNTLTEKIDKIDEKYNNLNNKVSYLQGWLGVAVDPNEDFINNLPAVYGSQDGTDSMTGDYVWEDLKQEAGTLKTGDICTAEDLINETVTLSYIDENDDEVFFKGRFNEDNQWDGNCIINKYSEGNLKYIMNADYESGKLVAYHQVFSYINASNIEVWAISSRTVEEKGNAGQTWTYFKEREWKKDFEKNYLKADDIIDEEHFYNMMDLKIEGYYNGYTSDGSFNDDNEDGTAYMIKYSEDGYVRMFYSGQFADGRPCDLTGKASMIALGRDGENYYFYCGKIDDTSQIGEAWQKISIEEIKQKVNNINYEGTLIWYGEVI